MLNVHKLFLIQIFLQRSNLMDMLVHTVINQLKVNTGEDEDEDLRKSRKLLWGANRILRYLGESSTERRQI